MNISDLKEQINKELNFAKEAPGLAAMSLLLLPGIVSLWVGMKAGQIAGGAITGAMKAAGEDL